MDVDEIKSLVGREVVYQGSDEIGRAAFRQYALAVEDFNRVYTDVEFARSLGFRDVIAPPTLICDTWQYVGGDMDENGLLEGRKQLPGVGGLRAGNDYEFFQPVYPDDILTATVRLKEVYERSARSGELVFIEWETTFVNQKGDLLAKSIDIGFRRKGSEKKEA